MGSEKRHNCENCANGCKSLFWVLIQAFDRIDEPGELANVMEYTSHCEGWQPREK